jgi:hypothetical protein
MPRQWSNWTSLGQPNGGPISGMTNLQNLTHITFVERTVSIRLGQTPTTCRIHPLTG